MPNYYPYAFAAENVRQGYALAAARAAVLWPLVSIQAVAGARRAGLPPPPIRPALHDAHAALHALWRRRLTALGDAGWDAIRTGDRESDVSTGRRYTYLANCPPFGIAYRGGGRPCHRLRVCPMCFAREATAELYGALEHAFFPGRVRGKSPGPSALPGVGVVAVRRTFDRNPADLAKAVAVAAKERMAEVVALKGIGAPLGAFVMATVSPRGEGVRFARTTLLLLPEEARPRRKLKLGMAAAAAAWEAAAAASPHARPTRRVRRPPPRPRRADPPGALAAGGVGDPVPGRDAAREGPAGRRHRRRRVGDPRPHVLVRRPAAERGRPRDDRPPPRRRRPRCRRGCVTPPRTVAEGGRAARTATRATPARRRRIDTPAPTTSRCAARPCRHRLLTRKCRGAPPGS
ncbi:MAG: hypothetical protein JWO31_127 [Phycisphaerales bacterium]|nr:hypothetical protein [Phycisphaerales bacterium]